MVRGIRTSQPPGEPRVVDAAFETAKRSVRNFLDGVPVPGGNADLYRLGPPDDALAGQTGVDLEPRGLLDPILLVLIDLGDHVFTLLEVDVTGRTGTDTATGVLDVDAVLDRDLEDRLALTTHEIPLDLICLRQTLGVFKDELDWDDRRAVFLVRMAHVHGAGTLQGDSMNLNTSVTILARRSPSVVPCWNRMERPRTKMTRTTAPILALLTLLLLGGLSAPPQTAEVAIDGWEESVRLEERPDGSIVYVLTGPDGTDEEMTPLQFAKRHFRREQSRTFINRLFNITSPLGIAWVGIGLLGQALFTGRMIVQWLASERKGRSTVPVAFWWMSLLGASMLLAYFIWRKDIVGVLGQGLGWMIYIRNLALIYGGRGDTPEIEDDPDPEPALEQLDR